MKYKRIDFLDLGLSLQEDVKNAHEKVRRAMSPNTRQRVEEEK